MIQIASSSNDQDPAETDSIIDHDPSQGSSNSLNHHGHIEVATAPVVDPLWKRSRKHEEQQHRRDNDEDRGINGRHDGSTTEELVKASKYYFELGSREAIRERMMFLKQHALLLRG
ncbi:hypothetical protein DM01DRAFT_1370312 [Hesseltinella vesiculosa]|uniref:Uncharacterized protein n=1 Tax=Hesseltinella vesiculosa TaxID=101127 RepID=A0A1X2GXW1_9FUNG|nr:hypothetical protein DM01DRAFT_1370312 [Hesseltinella vesiculosa]